MQTTPQVSSRQHQTSSPNGHRLKSISVIGGFLDGMQFDLADGLNCLIGARGTGKTTTLELLRYAIDALPTQAAERKRIESLVEENLAGGRIEVHVETKDGLPYTITRSWDEEPIVLAADGSPTAISLVGSGLFQADIFSQNEVECIADRAASQLAMFDNFEREAISQVDTQLNQVESALAANATRIIPLQDKLAALDDELGTLPSVEEKLKKFSTSRGEDSTEVDRAHAQKALRDRQRRAVDAAGEILRTMTRKLTSLTGQIDGQMATQIGPDMAAGPNGLLLREVTQGLSRCGREVDRLLEEARTRIAGAQEELARRSATLVTAHREQELAFRVVIEQHKQAQGEAAERAQLERRRNELLARRRLHQETAAQLKAVQGERQTLLSRLTELRDRRFGIRKDVVRRINEALSPTIRVSLMQHDDPRVYRRLVERGLRGPRMQHRVLAGKIVRAIGPADLGKAIHEKDIAALVDTVGLYPAQADKVMAMLAKPEWLFELETIGLLDRPRIELKDGDGYKDSLALSTGQKCTCILPILLLDSENPLLVDQPEDNLDNGFIYGTIVDSIRKIKRRRQLVFVAHNPNVPVLGDAEGVFVLASDGASARLVGAGSVDDCKSHIVTLLEGGEDAFRMRGERYAQ